MQSDHPRRCGENKTIGRIKKQAEGSPPQVRGKPVLSSKENLYARITPAGAGKTANVAASALGTWDHPRRCGENCSICLCATSSAGSPPQVRGKLSDEEIRAYAWRITPAGAGKTLNRSFRNQPFCSRAVQISFNFSNSLNVSLQSGSAR